MGLSTFLSNPPIRGLLWLSLTDTGRFLIRSSVSDGGGGQTETYLPDPSAAWAGTNNVACRIDALSGIEGEVADRVSDRSTHLVTINAPYSVSLNSDFQILNRGRYEITAIREHTGEMATQFEVTDLVPELPI